MRGPGNASRHVAKTVLSHISRQRQRPHQRRHRPRLLLRRPTQQPPPGWRPRIQRPTRQAKRNCARSHPRRQAPAISLPMSLAATTSRRTDPPRRRRQPPASPPASLPLRLERPHHRPRPLICRHRWADRLPQPMRRPSPSIHRLPAPWVRGRRVRRRFHPQTGRHCLRLRPGRSNHHLPWAGLRHRCVPSPRLNRVCAHYRHRLKAGRCPPSPPRSSRARPSRTRPGRPKAISGLRRNGPIPPYPPTRGAAPLPGTNHRSRLSFWLNPGTAQGPHKAGDRRSTRRRSRTPSRVACARAVPT